MHSTKVMFVLWRERTAAAEPFETLLCEARAPELLKLGARSLVMSFPRLPEAARTLPRPDGSVLAGIVSAWFVGELDARRAAELLRQDAANVAAYAVDEAVPLDYDAKSWPDGAVTPGIKQVTLLRRKPGLAHEEFIRSWYEVHTPLALRTHPLWAYYRNEVRKALTEGAPHYDGIVELMFRTEQDLLDPSRFFGSEAGMREILRDVKGWLDFEGVEYCPMQELMLSRA